MSSFFTYQTVQRDSLFTRLDFRPKLVMIICVTIVAFLWTSPVAGGLLMLTITLVGLFVGVTWKYIRTVYILMFSFGLMLIFFHGFFNKDGVKVLVQGAELTPLIIVPAGWFLIGGLTFTLEGMLYALNALFKSLSMVLIVPLAIFTTDVNNLIVGMVRSGIPYKIAFIFSSTLRFFPVLFEEIHSIIEAQRLRGLDMKKMNAVKKITVYAKVAIPLILGSLMKSQMLDVVLQSKSFSGDPDRTYLHESVLRTLDYVLIVVFLLFMVGSFVAYYAWGIGRFSWLLFS